MFDANFIANPYPIYQHLLASGRFFWVDYLGGAWLVPHYEDMMALLRDPRISAERAAPFVAQFPPEQQADLQQIEQFLAKGLPFLDGEEHLRLRRLVSKAFTPRTIEAMRPHVQRIADELIDAFAAEGRVELMHQFAHQLPALVIAELLDVPPADRLNVVRWSDDMAAFLGNASSTFEVALRAQQSMMAMRECFRRIVDAHRQELNDDFISLLLEGEDDDMLDEDELLAQCAIFLFAGHETARNLIGNGLLALLQHPEQLALLRNDPTLIESAIEEMGRYDCPVQLITRTVVEDFEIDGSQLKRGQTVAFLVGAANHDPSYFSDPERFDITRPESRAATYGTGAHVCIGRALAQLEGQVAISTLLRRLPNLQLVSETPEWSPNLGLRGLRTFPLTFDPQPRVATSAPPLSEGVPA